jgi:hypothetical protein
MVKPKHLYACLCVAGVLLPYSRLAPWLWRNGLDVPALWRDLFVNGIAASFGLDVIVSAVVLWVFAGVEDQRLGTRLWPAVVLATLTAGVSLGLPLYLYLREGKLRVEQAVAEKTNH